MNDAALNPPASPPAEGDPLPGESAAPAAAPRRPAPDALGPLLRGLGAEPRHPGHAGGSTGLVSAGLDRLVTGSPEKDAAKARDLSRMKRVAAGLLAFATVVFAVARFAEERGAPTWVGFVRAAAEAGMVGALADWFAVTALFRHPLGLPIPHTAIIPRRKDEIGAGLGEFVGSNFLNEAVVRERVRDLGAADRIGRWLAEPANAERLVSRISIMATDIVASLDEDDLLLLAERAVVVPLARYEWGPPGGRLLEEVVHKGAHHGLVDVLIRQAHLWVVHNRPVVQEIVVTQAPEWTPHWLNGRVADKAYREVLRFVREVDEDLNHPVRDAIDEYLLGLAGRMQHDPETIQRVESAKARMLTNPGTRRFLGDVVHTAKEMAIGAVGNADSELLGRLRAAVLREGERIVRDPAFRADVDRRLEDWAAYVVINYRAELTTTITETVARWDADETSRKVELQVGRDLQFIRINGTVVGALAGLVIHTVSTVLL